MNKFYVYKSNGSISGLSMVDINNFISNLDLKETEMYKFFCNSDMEGALECLRRNCGDRLTDKKSFIGYEVVVDCGENLRFGNEEEKIELVILPIPPQVTNLEKDVTNLEKEVTNLEKDVTNLEKEVKTLQKNKRTFFQKIKDFFKGK